MNDFFDNRRILEIIWKRRLHFIIIGIVAVALSAIFSSAFFMPPKFKSTARLYPINLSIMSEESETEQMLEVLNSKDLKLQMIDAFNLGDVYKVRREDPLFQTYVLAIYDKNFAARKTEFETAEISFLDRDPVRAFQMCDSLIGMYNLKVREMHASKNREMVKILNDNLVQRRKERDSLVERLTQVRRESMILDFEGQAQEVTRGYMRALAEGREQAAGTREIRKLYDNLIEKGAETRVMETQFNYLTVTIDSLRARYELHISEAQKYITYAHVVENPVIPDKKAYPVRWLIVAVSLFSALFVALLAMIALEYKK